MVPVLTQTNLPTLIPTLTQTPRATLEPTEFVNTVKKFFLQGEGCQTPCLFGIVPGQTTYAQAREIFSWLRNPLSKEKYPNGEEYYTTSIDYKNAPISIGVRISLDRDIVKSIYADIDLSRYSNIITERQDWEAYSLDNILSQYGSPTKVEFDLDYPHEEGFPEDIAWYDMIVTYEDIDLTIEYYHGQSVEGNFINACPLTDQFMVVMIYVGNDFENRPYKGVPLEKATSLTMTQFSKLFTQKSKIACFQISKDSIFSK
jgi:hypothetical protein